MRWLGQRAADLRMRAEIWRKKRERRDVGCEIRRLQPEDYPAAAAVMACAPVETVLMRGRLESAPSAHQHFLGEFDPAGELCAVCWNGANIIPWGFDSAGIAALAQSLVSQHVFANSLVGAAQQVLPLWKAIQPHFHAPREVREHQLSMVWQGRPEPGVVPDSEVRYATEADFDMVFPASVAMFIEEVGYDPSAQSASYRQRARELIAQRFTFVRIGSDWRGHQRVEFKADIGAFAGEVAQIQGVWVHPELRGRGLAAPAVLAVAEQIQRRLGATVHLYVNDFNAPAVRTYEKAGFTTVGEYATVML